MYTKTKQDLNLKCIICGEDLTTQQNECPKCKNVLGISVYTLKAVSIGDILFKKQLSKDVLAFAFDFEFDTQLDCFKNMQFDSIVKPFLGVVVTLNVSGNAGFGGGHVSAVFYGEHEIEVQLTDEQTKYIADKVMPFIIACAKGVDIDDLGLDLKLDNLDCKLDSINSHSKTNTNPTFEEDLECKDGIMKPIDIANAMFSITSDDFIVSQNMWDSLPTMVKTSIGETLQSDPRALVDLINYTNYNYKNDNFDELRALTEFTIKQHIECLDGAVNSFNELIEAFAVFEEDFLDDMLEKTLIKNNIKYNTYDAFEISDFTNEFTMFSVLNDNNEECIHIAVLDDEYRVFENIRELKDNKIFDLNDKNSISLELDEILALISKMGLIKEDLKSISEKDIEEMFELGNSNDLDFNVSEDVTDDELDDTIIADESTTNLERQLLLKQLEQLSDEDLMNELKRRMSLR